MNYTAIGDAINLTSRLEGLNKLYGSSIVASETIVDRANETFDFRFLDVVALREKVTLLRSTSSWERKALWNTTARWYSLTKVHSQHMQPEISSDPPSTVLIERCKAFLQVPPPADWRRVYISASKSRSSCIRTCYPPLFNNHFAGLYAPICPENDFRKGEVMASLAGDCQSAFGI